MLETYRQDCNDAPKLGGTTVSIDSGAEGPMHDPYSWTELTVYTKGHAVVLRCGLGVDLTIDSLRILGDEKQLFAEFIRVTGADPQQWEEWYYRARSRCKCGCRETRSMGGYPGDHYEICVKCGDVVSYDFNPQAII
jgi:hypothetical protein